MATATHKHAGTTLTISTAMPADELRHLTETTATTLEATGLHKGTMNPPG